jgi:hypothetical protein
MQIKLLLHSALYFEADIFIRKYRLKKDMEICEFMFFYNSQSKIGLITSTKSIVSVAYAFGFIRSKYSIYKDCKLLNFGSCGSENLPLGSIKEIVKVSDYHTLKNYYPIYIEPPLLETATLTTFITPNNDYSIKGLYDMEAVYFFESASKFALRENIRIIKIISDNAETNLDNFDHKILSGYISDKENQLYNYVDSMISEVNQENAIITIDMPNFSFSEQRLLHEVVRKIKALGGEVNAKDLMCDDFSQLKNDLEERLARYDIRY